MKYLVKKIIEPDYGCENSGRSIFDKFPEVRNSVEGGVATSIEGTYDENTHVFTFETDKFSTYALVYKDLTSSNDSSNSAQPTTPETGDPNDIRVWYLLLLASLGGLGLLGLSKKKKVND